MSKVIVNGTMYKVLEEQQIGKKDRTHLILTKLNGTKRFHAVKYDNGQISTINRLK